MKEELDYGRQEVQLFKEKNTQIELKRIEEEHKIAELHALIHEKGRKLEQLGKELGNTELMLKMKQ